MSLIILSVAFSFNSSPPAAKSEEKSVEPVAKTGPFPLSCYGSPLSRDLVDPQRPPPSPLPPFRGAAPAPSCCQARAGPPLTTAGSRTQQIGALRLPLHHHPDSGTRRPERRNWMRSGSRDGRRGEERKERRRGRREKEGKKEERKEEARVRGKRKKTGMKKVEREERKRERKRKGKRITWWSRQPVLISFKRWEIYRNGQRISWISRKHSFVLKQNSDNHRNQKKKIHVFLNEAINTSKLSDLQNTVYPAHWLKFYLHACILLRFTTRQENYDSFARPALFQLQSQANSIVQEILAQG